MALAQNVAINALGSGQQVYASLRGHPDLLSFVDPVTNSTLLQFDAVLNEAHSRESPTTRFPIEDGSSISDHVQVEPFELQLQGMVTDSPIGTQSSLITEGVTTALSAVAPPLTIAAGGAAYALWLAQTGTSRSKNAYAALLRLQGGDRDAKPHRQPKPFDVITKLRRYPSMMIKSLSVPRDPSVTNAIFVSVSLTQVVVVRPQAVNLQILANPALAAAKAKTGEQDLSSFDRFQEGYDTQKVHAAKLKEFGSQVLGGLKAAVK